MSIGPHDLGGMKGHGPIPVGAPEPEAFPEGWEGRVVGAIIGTLARGLYNVDEFRAGIESLPPVAYMRIGYYEKWLHTLERNLLAHGVLTLEQIETRLRALAEDPGAAAPQREDPAFEAMMRELIAEGAPILQPVERPPAHAAGARVRARVVPIHRPGDEHTRVPGYVQGRAGVVELVHPGMLLPDANVAHRDERAEHVYTVAFRARDLWDDGDPRSSVRVDLWESHLEPA